MCRTVFVQKIGVGWELVGREAQGEGAAVIRGDIVAGIIKLPFQRGFAGLLSVGEKIRAAKHTAAASDPRGAGG